MFIGEGEITLNGIFDILSASFYGKRNAARRSRHSINVWNDIGRAVLVWLASSYGAATRQRRPPAFATHPLEMTTKRTLIVVAIAALLAILHLRTISPSIWVNWPERYALRAREDAVRKTPSSTQSFLRQNRSQGFHSIFKPNWHSSTHRFGVFNLRNWQER
jgi:hypothetical protein